MEETLPKGYNYIKNEVKTFLSSFGFKPYKTATLYRTTENDLLQFLSFQKGISYLSNQMTINVVQQGLFAPGCSFGILQPGNRIGQFANAKKDKWWFCNDVDKVKEGIAEIKEILLKDVLPFYNFSDVRQNIPELLISEKYKFVWWMPTTFVDKGYFLLKAGLYNEAIEVWEKHEPSKVPKFKSIKKLTQEDRYLEIDKILKENGRMTREKLKI